MDLTKIKSKCPLYDTNGKMVTFNLWKLKFIIEFSNFNFDFIDSKRPRRNNRKRVQQVTRSYFVFDSQP
jgi:hypothetical protein